MRHKGFNRRILDINRRAGLGNSVRPRYPTRTNKSEIPRSNVSVDDVKNAIYIRLKLAETETGFVRFTRD